MKTETAVKLTLAFWVCAAALVFFAVSDGDVSSPMLVFTGAALFALQSIFPALGVRIRELSPRELFRLSAFFAVLLIPLVLSLSLKRPYPSGMVFIIPFLLIYESVFKTALYRFDRVLYNVLTFAIVLFPLIAGALFIESSYSGLMFNVSPFGFLYSVIQEGFSPVQFVYFIGQGVSITVVMLKLKVKYPQGALEKLRDKR